MGTISIEIENARDGFVRVLALSDIFVKSVERMTEIEIADYPSFEAWVDKAWEVMQEEYVSGKNFGLLTDEDGDERTYIIRTYSRMEVEIDATEKKAVVYIEEDTLLSPVAKKAILDGWEVSGISSGVNKIDGVYAAISAHFGTIGRIVALWGDMFGEGYLEATLNALKEAERAKKKGR